MERESTSFRAQQRQFTEDWASLEMVGRERIELSTSLEYFHSALVLFASKKLSVF